MVEALGNAPVPEKNIPELVKDVTPELIRGGNPELIQGGMGVGVSDWRLARAVAVAGQELGRPVLGVISGVGLPILMPQRLQERDPDTIRALNALGAINPEIAENILNRFLPKPGQKYKLPQKPEVLITGSQEKQDEYNNRAFAAAFVEVWLAKEGHKGPIGMNLLEKVQLSHLPIILGAMAAGLDTLIVGAGIPLQIPEVLENFANNKEASYRIDVEGSDSLAIVLDPNKFVPRGVELKRPKYYAIISSHVLAMVLEDRAKTDGFIIEGPLAGGHNAPPRKKNIFDEKGQPVYGEKDEPDLDVIRKLGKPFWFAGSWSEKLEEAKAQGAVGIQGGSVFALSNESGFTEEVKDCLRTKIRNGTLGVTTSAIVSPTGYPFQVVLMEGSLSDPDVYNERIRSCIYGYLVHARRSEKGKILFLCPAEPVDAYVRKGGDIKDTEGRVCLCSGLAAAVGQGRPGEPVIITFGKDVEPVKKLIEQSADGRYSAKDAIGFVFSKSP